MPLCSFPAFGAVVVLHSALLILPSKKEVASDMDPFLTSIFIAFQHWLLNAQTNHAVFLCSSQFDTVQACYFLLSQFVGATRYECPLATSTAEAKLADELFIFS